MIFSSMDPLFDLAIYAMQVCFTLILVDTRGVMHKIDRKRTVVRVAFHHGVILGIESIGTRSDLNLELMDSHICRGGKEWNTMSYSITIA
jgi:hypothetical protein